MVFSPQEALVDTIFGALCIGSRGKVMKEDFANYLEGANRVKNHIFARALVWKKLQGWHLRLHIWQHAF